MNSAPAPYCVLVHRTLPKSPCLMANFDGLAQNRKSTLCGSTIIPRQLRSMHETEPGGICRGEFNVNPAQGNDAIDWVKRRLGSHGGLESLLELRVAIRHHRCNQFRLVMEVVIRGGPAHLSPARQTAKGKPFDPLFIEDFSCG